jgi:1-phosphofructokinase
MMRSPPHIFTLTGNLVAERTLEFEQWSPGRTQRAHRESFQVGGKGINVAKMLTRLRAPNTALCFTGGAPGAECEAWLRARKLSYRAFPTTTVTRCGTVVRDGSGSLAETTFLGPDAAPDPKALRACAKFLNAQRKGRVLAVCGSMPGWEGVAYDPLRDALARWAARGLLVVDTYGPPLAWLVGQKVELVKINAAELAGSFPAAARLESLPGAVRRWIVTDGPRPVRIRDADGYTAQLLPPIVKEVSPVGSGDVLLACVLVALFHRGEGFRDAVTYALPYAAANAAHPGVAEFA